MPQKACVIGALYSLLASPPSVRGQLIELNQSQSQATLLIEQQPYTLALTPGIGKLIALKNRLVVFDRTHQKLIWLSFFDLHLHHTLHPTGQPAAIDAAEISLAQEFAQGKVEDVAALEFPGGVLFILSQPWGPGEIAVKTLSFILPNTQSPSPSEATPLGIPAPPTPPVVAGLAGAKNSPPRPGTHHSGHRPPNWQPPTFELGPRASSPPRIPHLPPGKNLAFKALCNCPPSSRPPCSPPIEPTAISFTSSQVTKNMALP